MREEVVSAGAGNIVKPVPVKSIMPSCSALKVAYSDCFNRWYTDKFVTNRWDKVECFFEMEAYRACITNSTRSFRSEDGR